jgi:acyl phosphate:glycerol-3-phosphate acyltransferase
LIENPLTLLLPFFILEFMLGSLMFSYWLAKGRGKDLKEVRDGNPGASNLWRVSGWRFGFLGLFLDYVKGFVPLVFIVESGRFSGLELALLAAAPVLGHAFSPFLRFSGGKAIAVTFGIWSAMSKGIVPSLMGAVFILYSLQRSWRQEGPTSPEDDTVRLFSGMLAALLYLAWRGDLNLLLLWVLNAAILGYRHKKELIVILKGRKKSGGVYVEK